jgi:6-phosphofructokinase 1
MKIGVVHFGSFSMGATQIVTSLIEGISKDTHHLYGVEYNRQTNEIEMKELHKDSTQIAKETGHALLRSFPDQVWKDSQKLEALSQLDSIIVLGGREHQLTIQGVATLHVPLSIFNDVEGSLFTLGYDTALNSITNDIEKIRDTASSLSYEKLRVFNVQIPGEMSTPLLWNTALAVHANVVTSADEHGIENVKQVIREKEMKGEGYCFIMMDRSVDPTIFEEPITSEFDVDWKVAIYDESQCVGPFPTALDKILTIKMIDKILKWIETSPQTGKLVIVNNQVEFQSLNQ